MPPTSAMRAPLRGRRGFSIVEVMISAGVLGIALVAVVQLHVYSIRGVARSRQTTTANQIATQRAEMLAAQSPEAISLPACPNGPGPVGCRADPRSFAVPKSCTTWLSGADVPQPTGTVSPSNASEDGYRLDIVLADHPDATNQDGALLATLSVCWRDEAGEVQQVQTWRLLVPGA